MIYAQEVAGLGRFWLRPLRLSEDLPLVHRWVTEPRAQYWGLVGRDLSQVSSAYREIAQRADVYLGFHETRPAFLAECYWPGADPIAAHYPVEPGDRGMHILIAPPEQRLHGFSWTCFRVLLDFIWRDPATKRVVVEPDIRNAKIHALNRRAGFRYQRPLVLPHKTAHLAFCTRDDYLAAIGGESRVADSSTHPRPEVWAAVNAALVCKAIAELAHELVLQPKPTAAGAYVLANDDGDAEYRFRARRLALDHWDIELDSLERHLRGERAPLDALEFFLEFRPALAMSADVLPVYLEEISSTLYGAAYKHQHQRFSAGDLVHANFQEIEGAMSEGHPGFIANSGRIGFDAADYSRYAPEACASLRPIWLAAHKQRANFTSISTLTYDALLERELPADQREVWEHTLRAERVDPNDYLLLPVHPWQWENKLALTFAPDLAKRDLICLGYGPDDYRAQQSIRTWFNADQPERCYVKTALSVLNMGFMRGLSAEYMASTPAINEYLAELIDADVYLRACGFTILREVAAVGYRNPYFEAALPKASAHRKMLAALWRESPVALLEPGQRALTMAALLHRDREGSALLPQLIAASGLTALDWLARYLRCYLAPLLHCFYRYDLAFMPHGENVILIAQDHVPQRALLKDIAEEATIMDPERELPEALTRLRVNVPEHIKSLSIFTDVFDGILRYMAQILSAHTDVGEQEFWQCVAACVKTYQSQHPELREKFSRYDLFVPEFARSCLNRLQLRNNLQMVDLADPAQALQFAGVLPNPIAEFK